ncbi:unnamed protein product [Enterobius vermicularis]|uniref:Gamma-glutamyltranspeptidase n=1 Tax=Enterobius vermicularis TaxID=51028 RepID=A0A3P6I601_ENTVE|nr:unnamed protein product [Enterobius vermicularis]
MKDDGKTPRQPSLSLLGKYTKVAVAADNVFCSEIGRDILLQGGNAVESAIATLFCIGIMDAHSTGIGGGHFMTIYNAYLNLLFIIFNYITTTKECTVVDAREVAPLAATKNMYVNNSNSSKKGWLAIAVTGEIHGYWREYTTFGGNIEWKQLLQPTIKLLDEGYPTSYVLAKALNDTSEWIYNEPTMKPFINPLTGKVYAHGEQIKTRTKLSEFLKQLANSSNPQQLFYNSSFTETMANEIQRNGGILTLEDFHRYTSKMYSGSDIIYTELSNGRRMCGPPPPSGSAVTQAIINIMDGYFAEEGAANGDSAEILHRFIEASKFAYAARSHLSDMAFNSTALEVAKNITSAEYASYVRSQITNKAHEDAYYGGDFEDTTNHGTSNLVIIDADGNAVAVTSTINTDFGAGVISESTGVLWNDEMDDFSTPGQSNYYGYAPSKANFIEPGKRPMSSASPTIIFNPNDPLDTLGVGTSGGSKIITGTSYVAIRTMWLNENVKQAVDAVRVHNQLTPNIVFYEDGFDKDYHKDLEHRGHRLQLKSNLSVVTVARKFKDGCIYANSDYRKGTESDPAGY